MKKYLLTGIVILLPVVVTFWILSVMVNFLTKPFLGFMLSIFDHVHLGLPPTLLIALSKFVILVFLLIVTVIIGIIAHWVFVHFFFRWMDTLVHKIPVVNSIYTAAKDVVHSLFSPKSPSFSKVVLVPFPCEQSLSIGLISKDDVPILEKASQTDTVSVFVPGTPNPSVGFLLMFRKEQLVFTDMKVNEAMKFVISCAVMMPTFKINIDK